MKKLLLSIALVCCIYCVSIAQNYKNLSVPVHYLKIPAIIQNASINTYKVELAGSESSLNNLGYNVTTIGDKLNLRAFVKVEGEAENRIVFRFPGYGNLYGSLSSKSATVDGKPVTKYYYSYSYTLPMSYEIFAGAKKIAGGDVKDNSLVTSNGPDQYSYSTDLFNSESDARNFWESPSGRADLMRHIKKNFDYKLKSFPDKVRNDIDYQEKKETEEFGYFKTTKKADYTAYELMAESAKRALSVLEAGKSREGLRTRLDSAMTFWITNMKGLDPTNGDQDKLFFACANNLAVAYYWLDDIDSSLYYITQAQRANVREGRLTMLKYQIDTRKKELEQLKAFGIDPYTGPAPASDDELQAIAAKADKERKDREDAIAAKAAADAKASQPVVEVLNGYIIDRQDKKVTGKFNCYKQFNGAKSYKNFFVADGSDKEMALEEAFVKRYECGSEVFELVRFNDNAKGKTTLLLPVIYESNKIKVFRVYDSSNNLCILYKRVGEDIATNTNDLTFMVGYKKMMAKYFEDCPSVSTRAAEGEYTNSEQMKIAAALDYTNCK